MCRAGELTQWLELTALAEDPGLVPSTQWLLTTPVPGTLTPCQAPGVHVEHIHTHAKQIFFKN